MRAEQRRSTASATFVGQRVLSATLLATLLSTLLTVGACVASPRPGDTVVLASGSDLESANPVVTMHGMSRQMQRHMLFVPLVRLDSLLEPQPWLARSWQWSDTRDSLTFTLRGDVYWHDGVQTTSRDVVLTFRAVTDRTTASPRAGDLRSLLSVDAVNDSVVRFVFSETQQVLPLIFAELPPVPFHVLGSVPFSDWRQHAFATAPVGNGPFRFVSREAGQRWRFVRNDSFPSALGGPPLMRSVVIAVVDEPATKFAGLVSGDLDVAGVSPSMAGLVQRDPLLQLETPPVLFTTMLAFNTTRAPFDDVRVRRAVAMAVNRERIVDVAVAGYAVPATGAVPPGIFPDIADVMRQSMPATDTRIVHAQALLDSAGWQSNGVGVRMRNGQALAVTLLTVSTGDLAVEQLVQDDLQRVGIELTVRSVELATFLTQLRAREKSYDLAYTGVPGDLALGHLTAMFHGAQAGSALDYTGYRSAALDSLLDAASRAVGPSARALAWARVSASLDSAAPAAFVYHARGVQGRARSLNGVVMDLRGELATVAQWSRRE